MDKEQNKIERIILSNGNEQGLIKQEIDLFAEFIETLGKDEVTKVQPQIIDFNSLVLNDNMQKTDLIKFAAQSQQIESKNIQSQFYISSNSDYAIKLDIRNNDQVYASVIADNSINITGSILYCKQLNKYYTSNIDSDFYIGTFDSFDISEFSFQLIYPLGTIRFQKTNDSFIPFIVNGQLQIKDTNQENNILFLKIETQSPVKAFVLNQKNYIDFIKFENNILEIPQLLLSIETILTLY